MKQAIGHIPMYNIIIVFIVITFGFLSATLSYMKAFKVNGLIAKSLENYEGYNYLSDVEIANNLTSLGYRTGNSNSYTCPKKNEKDAVAALDKKQHVYCIYEYDYYESEGTKSRYFNYGIVTYIFFDVPVIGGTFKIPVYSETEKIFHFTEFK